MIFRDLIIVVALLTSSMPNSQVENKLSEIKENIEIIDIHEGIIYENVYDENATSVKELKKFNENGPLLKEGTASEDILKLRRFLKDIGYMNIEDGYYYDSRTKEAVRDYQKKKGLVADGIVGGDTYGKINQDLEVNNILLPDIQLVFNAEVPEARWIIINKTNNTLYHLIGEEVIKKYPVATGKYSNLTPEGKFKIVTKLRDPAWGGAGRYAPVRGGAPNNPLGKRWMGLNKGGGGEYGIHGNSDSNSIGRYVSLGCIRMFNSDVELIYELIELGTPVWIGSEEKLQEFGIIYIIE
ncbi:L,D-transpeptidase family protein [Tissierella sp. Yu-01]|uniref:L,D-transpeptidase family protein n=1 Tax=Tissierella sp. Yu-01 TaxID=3035694 RepID=UPI00240D20D1|nr:L,D-transpeptidase family protein [Tissierella sp. Yu-01]WFA08961.1 L,D-transpeptidase family protein [Tissierella sp. Yu-01]